MTKNKLNSWAMLSAFLLIGTTSFAQSIHFNYKDGTSTSYNLEDVRKINFDADVMNLHLWDGSIYAWNVSTIGFYQYDETSMNVQEWLNHANAWDVILFPNPTSNTLNIRYNLPKADQISIALYDMQGKLMLEKRLGKKNSGEHTESIDLNDLIKGTYVCRISSQQSSITKQIIKQ